MEKQMRAKEAIDVRSALEKMDFRIGVPSAQATVAGEANRLPKYYC
jgi:hypothetical protein